MPSERKADVIRIIRSMLRFVAQCHAKKIAYRDIKPENFLFLDDTDGSPLKATDFGLAIHLQEGEQAEGRCGTPHYMAPEVLDSPYGMECDVWSCGVVAHQLLTGRLPFQSHPGKGIPVYDSAVLFEAIKNTEIDYDTSSWRRYPKPSWRGTPICDMDPMVLPGSRRGVSPSR